MIDRVGAARSLAHDTDDDHDLEPDRPPHGARADGYVGSAVSAHIDGGLAAFVRANDDVLHIGMNRSAAPGEIAKLSTYARVTALPHDGPWDLNRPEGREAFAAELRSRGLGSEQADAVMNVIDETNATGKDEIAHLALLWSAGERGEPIPNRVVISGHSSGEIVWDGEGDGEIAFDDVRRLARVMPRAAAQIEDLHFSACSTAGQIALADKREGWLAAFPNLKTLWAYDGAAPQEGGGHLADWARATRGPTARLPLTSDRASGHVGVWDRTSGYRDASGPLAPMRARQRKADARFDTWTSGARRATSSDDPALVADYRTYRALSGRSDLPADERGALGVKAEQLLRVRYFEGAIRREIDREYGPTIAKGFETLGLEAPSFATLSYREARAKIDDFERAYAARAGGYSADVAQAREILGDIRSLDWARIPASWCRH